MKCTNCAKLVPDSANFCGYCGHPLKANARADYPRKDSVGQTQAQKGMPLERILKIIGLVLLAGAGAYALYGAITVILYVWVPIWQHVVNLLLPLSVIGFIFLARKKPIIAAAAAIALIIPNYQNLPFAILLGSAALLLLISGILDLRVKE